MCGKFPNCFNPESEQNNNVLTFFIKWRKITEERLSSENLTPKGYISKATIKKKERGEGGVNMLFHNKTQIDVPKKIFQPP